MTIHINMFQLQNLKQTIRKTVSLTTLEITQLQENTLSHLATSRERNAETYFMLNAIGSFNSTPH